MWGHKLIQWLYRGLYLSLSLNTRASINSAKSHPIYRLFRIFSFVSTWSNSPEGREHQLLEVKSWTVLKWNMLNPLYKKKIYCRVFCIFTCDRTRSNGFKRREGRLRLDVRRKLFTIRWRGSGCTSCSENPLVPHPWQCSWLGWMGFWAT